MVDQIGPKRKTLLQVIDESELAGIALLAAAAMVGAAAGLVMKANGCYDDKEQSYPTKEYTQEPQNRVPKAY